MKEKTDLAPEAVKSLFEKLEKGMSMDDAERITGIRGHPKENNAPHEQVYYYDYDKSYLYIIYAVAIENGKRVVSVSEKHHVIDHLTIEQREEKRREAWGRWVQQRREIMRKKKEAEELPPNNHNTPDGK